MIDIGKKHRSFPAERSRSMGKEKEDEASDNVDKAE